MTTGKHPVVVIGAGPAGMTAAMQLARCGIPVTLFEKETPGGLLLNANWVENYPGFPDGISGPDLVNLFVEQLTRHGVSIRKDNVGKLDWDGDRFLIQTTSQKWEAEIAIISSGTVPKKPETIVIESGVEKHIHYHVRELDGATGLRVAIVGGGDAAFDYALNLAKYHRVLLLHRGNQAHCLPLLWTRCSEADAVDIRSEIQVLRLINQGSSVALICKQGSEQREVTVGADVVLYSIGRNPNTPFFTETIKSQLDRLSDQRLFLAGDVCRGRYRQTAIAVADGLLAAMQIDQMLKGSTRNADCSKNGR